MACMLDWTGRLVACRITHGIASCTYLDTHSSSQIQSSHVNANANVDKMTTQAPASFTGIQHRQPCIQHSARIKPSACPFFNTTAMTFGQRPTNARLYPVTMTH
ncbi:hypothetical protein ACJBU6_11128 [Exserohilum turcicum]